jgi:hypothetical protein
MTVALVLFICFVCPFVEMFDQWDHTIQTGNDIEYALVVLALCVGVAHMFARLISGLPLFESVAEFVSRLRAHTPPLFCGRGSFILIAIPLSPPVSHSVSRTSQTLLH